MSEKSANVANAQATKKLRRGVSNQTQAVSQLRFHEKDAAQNGLFLGILDEVRVDWSVNADGKSFTGMKMPRLTFHFTSPHSNPNERRHVYHTLFPVESNIDTIPGGSKEWQVNQLFNWIKHMLDVFYLKGRQLTPEEENALSLPFEDYDDEGNFIVVDPEVVLAGYAAVFNSAAQMLNGQFNLAEGEVAKPCYKDANGKPYILWMKLLRHKKDRKRGWINVGQNGELAFDSFIGAGAVEIQKPNTPPAILRIDLAKESITPKDTESKPTIGGQGPVGQFGGVVAGASTIMPSGDAGAFNAAGEDMPF